VRFEPNCERAGHVSGVKFGIITGFSSRATTLVSVFWKENLWTTEWVDDLEVINESR
jgi:hypothetical protein